MNPKTSRIRGRAGELRRALVTIQEMAKQLDRFCSDDIVAMACNLAAELDACLVHEERRNREATNARR